MSGWFRLLASLGLALLLGLTGCGPAELPADQAGASSWGAEPAPEHTMTVETQQLPLWREVPATVRSLDHIVVSAEVEGRVLEVHADLGDAVTAGQTLARLDPSVLRSQVEAAQAAVDLAEAERSRIDRLVADKVASEREADAAASLERQARARLEVATTALSRATVQAPVDAIVESREVGPGDLAVPGTALFRLYDPSRLVGEAQIPVDDRAPIHVGTTLEFVIDDFAGQAAVVELAPTSDPRSRTLRVRVALEARAGAAPWAPGSFGLLRYPAGEVARLSVPPEAVRRVGQLEIVLVADSQGQWRRRAVRSGALLRAEGGPRLEILAGLQAGERIGW